MVGCNPFVAHDHQEHGGRCGIRAGLPWSATRQPLQKTGVSTSQNQGIAAVPGRPRRTPDVSRAAASSRVSRLQAVKTTSRRGRSWRETLRKARGRATFPPSGERIEHTAVYRTGEEDTGECRRRSAGVRGGRSNPRQKVAEPEANVAKLRAEVAMFSPVFPAPDHEA